MCPVWSLVASKPVWDSNFHLSQGASRVRMGLVSKSHFHSRIQILNHKCPPLHTLYRLQVIFFKLSIFTKFINKFGAYIFKQAIKCYVLSGYTSYISPPYLTQIWYPVTVLFFSKYFLITAILWVISFPVKWTSFVNDKDSCALLLTEDRKAWKFGTRHPSLALGVLSSLQKEK